MLGRVWLLGSCRIYPFPLPTAVARRAGRARLGSAGGDCPLPLHRPSPKDLAPPGTGRTPAHTDSARGQQTLH